MSDSAAAGAGGAGAGASGAVGSKGPLLEYSVVYTDRAYNLMSDPFCEAMRDISSTLKKVYNAHSTVLIPGSGSYGMEAAAWAFGVDKKALIIRNGYFSFRWSDINAAARIFSEEVVLNARPPAGVEVVDGRAAFAPCPIDEVVAKIREERPAVVFAPHVETATGMILPDDYIAAVAAAAHEVDAVFCLDGIAAGNMWVDMGKLGLDAYLTAPQKGWSGPACCGIVMLSERGRERVVAAGAAGTRTSFTCNLPKWLAVMEKYDAGGFMYYTTLPTDALMTFRDVIKETEEYGFAKAKEQMAKLGAAARAGLAERGFPSASAEGFQAPGVVVVFSSLPGMFAQFKAEGLQIAGGVPWKCGEDKLGMDTKASTFRLGLFGLDKLKDVDGTVAKLLEVVDAILAKSKASA